MNMLANPQPDSDHRSVDFGGLLAILGRYRWWLLLGPVVGLAAAVLIVAVTPPTFTATGAVFVDPRSRRVVTEEVIPTGYGNDASLVESQVSILVSDSVLRRVIQQEKLTSDPDYYKPQTSSGPIARIKALIRGPRPVVDPETQVVEQLARDVRVKRAAKSFVLSVEVSASTPAKAARIANTLMQAYLDDQMAAKAAESRRASALIDARIGELREKVRQAETRLDEFRKANRIVVSEGGVVSEQQLGKLNLELATARSVAAEAAARQEQARAAAQAGTPELLPEAVRSGLIQKLREQYSQVARREAALSQQLKSRHPVLIDVRSQLRELQVQIDDELRRIAASSKSEAAIAKAREREVLAATERAKGEVARSNTAQITMRELEQDLATSRQLLGGFITRAKETLEQANLTTPEARIISPAAVPTRQSFPPPLLFLALGALGGLGVGIGRALLGDAFETTKRRPDRLQSSLTHLPLRATLPALSDPRSLLERTQAWFGSQRTSLHFSDFLQAVTKPETVQAVRYKQAIAQLTGSLGTSGRDGNAVVVAVLSSRPGSGGSSTALAIAYAAALAGDKVLLVDASSVSSDLSDTFASRLNPGKVVVLDSRDDLASIAVHDQQTGLAVLPIALANLRGLKAAQWRRLADGLSALAQSYDMVVIDCGRVGADNAALALLRVASEVLIVAREVETPGDITATADMVLSACAGVRPGLILNAQN